MYIILNLDDFRNIEVVTGDAGETELFSDRDDAFEFAEAHFALYQIVELEED